MKSNEHEDMNTNRSNTESEDEIRAAPDAEESTVSDLLHVFGFKKRKGNARNVQPAPQKPATVDLSEPADTQVSTNPAETESLNDTEADPEAEDSEEGCVEVDFPNTAIVLRDEVVSTRRRPEVKKIAVSLLVIVGLVVGYIYALPYLTGPVPPSEDVVASYSGRNITIEELKSFIVLEQAKEMEHIYCDKHGYDHTQCTADEECESHPIDSLEGYQQMVTNLAVEQIIQEWASTQGVTQREDVRHGLKDLLDNASVNQLMEQIYEEEITPESISSWEIQQYYDDNRESYSGRTLAEAEEEIRQILVSQKDEDFFTNYIEKLKQTAGLQVNFDLLKVKEPTDDEISTYYEQNTTEFEKPQKAEALEIRITAGDVQNLAAEAIRKIRSGESFDSVASAYGRGGQVSKLSVEKGSGEAAIEAAIWKMQPGDISDPITNTDGSASIIKMTSTTQAGARPLSEVKSSIRSILLQKNIDSEYAIRKDEALFSVHSRRYTLGDFYTEFKELSPEYQVQFSTFEQKQQLVEQLIAKELLLEETGDSSSNDSEQHSYDELKIQYLAQILHQQEVDEKLTDPTEDEMKEFYDKNRDSFFVPVSVQISLIWVDQGLNGEKMEQARLKANEALSMLNGGTDFAEVAKKYSEDGSAALGGEIEGIFDQSHLPEQLGTAVFALKAGETSGIIEYSNGYYIVKVRQRTEARQLSYEESTESIKAHLSEEKHSKLESDMEKVLLENANFTVYDTTLKKLLKEQNSR